VGLQRIAFRSPANAAPYLHVVPLTLAAFGTQHPIKSPVPTVISPQLIHKNLVELLLNVIRQLQNADAKKKA